MSKVLTKNAMVMGLEEAAELIESQKWQAGVESWKITQTSKAGVKELTVYGLNAKIADEEFFVLSDMQNTLMHNDLSMLLPELIKKVKNFKNNAGHDVISLDFATGEKVTIEALPEVSAPDEIFELGRNKNMKCTVINGSKMENKPSQVYREAFFNAIQTGAGQSQKKKKDKEFLKNLVLNGVKMINTMDAEALMNETVKQINEIGVASIDFITDTMALLTPTELNSLFPTGEPIANTFDLEEPIGEDHVHAYICINDGNEDLNSFKNKSLLIADMIEELIHKKVVNCFGVVSI